MTEQTDAAEVVPWAMARAIADPEVARLLAARETAAEARGAERALREAAEVYRGLDDALPICAGHVTAELDARAAAAQVACVDPSRSESGSTDPEVRQSADRTSSPSRVPGEGS